jgi:uncharacterized protein YfbU (UPF0304 family)
MKLTDAERLILLNQHDILAKLYPRDRSYHESVARMLREGFHADWGGRLSEVIPEERLDFAMLAYEACVMLNVPFTGFTDKRLNDYASFGDCEFEEGDSRSDEEYRSLIEQYEARKPVRKVA